MKLLSLSANALDLPNLPNAGGSLGILEVNLVLLQVDNEPEVVVKTLDGLEALEYLDEL